VVPDYSRGGYVRRDCTLLCSILIATGSPSLCIKEIEARQSIVSLFCARPHLREDIIFILKGLEDASRLVQKLTLGRGETDDLLSLRKAILGWTNVFRRLTFERGEAMHNNNEKEAEGWQNLEILLSHMVDLTSLAERIESAVDAIDFDKKERIAAGFELETDKSGEPDCTLPFGRPPYGGRWRIKPQ
jgi:DNA mismatch repair ATPase MutS